MLKKYLTLEGSIFQTLDKNHGHNSSIDFSDNNKLIMVSNAA